MVKKGAYARGYKSKYNKSAAAKHAAAKKKKAAATARAVANARSGGFLGSPEYKFFDSTPGGTIANSNTWTLISQTGAPNVINVPQQGSGQSQRDGRVMHITSISVNGTILLPQDTFSVGKTGTEDQLDEVSMRVILFWDMQTNAADPNPLDVMNANSFKSHRNLQYTNRFIVLKDRHYTVKPQQTESRWDGTNWFKMNGGQVHFRMNKKFPHNPIKVTFKASTGNISDVTDNTIHMMVLWTAPLASAGTLITEGQPSITTRTRIRFKG